jgi:hypothetical protein
MRKNKIYLLLFILGLGIGIFSGLSKARASSPEGQTSGGEQPASVYFDEFWQATGAIVSTVSGYQGFDPSRRANTPVAGRLEKLNNPSRGWVARLFPKMVVTKWKVHGHIHFE